MRLGHRTRVGLLGTATIFVTLVAIAFAVGGSGSSGSGSSGGSSAGMAVVSRAAVAPVPSAPTYAQHGPATGLMPAPAIAEAAPPALPTGPDYANGPASGSGGVASGGGGSATGTVTDGAIKASDASVTSGSSLAATRIVKTGYLTLKIDKTAMQSKTSALEALATSEGGYVANSDTELGAGTPSSEVVLRIPVSHFADAITRAQALGHTVSLSQSAADVTGKYVDLSAREHALAQTRSTYLTILSKATTIGATLAVQQRIDGIQQQIEQLQGQLKLLGDQSSYSTLTIDLVTNAPAAAPVRHHARGGIGKAWHDSWARFGRGVDAIVGAIGPIVFALLLIGLLALISVFGYRAVRRATGGPTAAA